MAAQEEISKKEAFRRLNESFINHVNKVHKSDATATLRGNCEEYIKFVDRLDQPKENKANSQPAPVDASSAFSFFKNTNSQAPSNSVATAAITTTAMSTQPAAATPAFPSKPAFNFGTKLDSNFKFGSNVTATPSAPAPFVNSSFSVASTPKFGSTVPTFGGFLNTTSSLTASPKAQGDEKSPEEGEVEDENSDEPPKVADAKMDEEGSIYSKVIKLFFLKDKKFEAMGKGMVHIKKLPTGKNQLLVRGENALGSIWLNVVLDKTVTVKKQGKKDVQCLCFTKLPADGSDDMKYVTYLLRTGSESDADDLESNLLKFQE